MSCQKWTAALIAFARRCEGLFRRRIPVQGDAYNHADLFMRSGWLKRHDKTISGLDKFEDIRYPDANLKQMAVTAEWSGPAGKVEAYGGMRTPKQYKLVVSDIDDLIADAFKISSWDPGKLMGTNHATVEAITRRLRLRQHEVAVSRAFQIAKELPDDPSSPAHDRGHAGPKPISGYPTSIR